MELKWVGEEELKLLSLRACVLSPIEAGYSEPLYSTINCSVSMLLPAEVQRN